MRSIAVVFFLCLIWTCPVRAEDFAGDSVPGKWIEAVAPEDLPPLAYPQYFNQLDQARAQAFSGRYKLALQTLRNGHGPDVDMIRATALRGVGRLEEALALLSNANLVDRPKAQLDRAAVLDELGRTDAAIALLREFLQKHPDSLQGHFQLGRLCAEIGDLASARAQYGWFVDPPQDYLNKWRGQHEKLFDSADDATTLGRALDRWAILNGQYQNDDALHNTILDLFVKSYDVIDRQYWPAHVAAAEYYAAHDEADDARKELKLALAANPNDPTALALLGKLALKDFDFDTAESVVETIRRENGTSIVADLLEVRTLLREQLPQDAGYLVARVLEQRPRSIEAIGLAAACAALQLHEKETSALLAMVEKIDPQNASAYFEVAEQLGAMRQFPRAEAMYKVAIERAPWWTEPRNGLGLLYTQSGDEDLARSTLDAAHQLDPFNLLTTNYLRLLDQLAGFDRKETAHFIVEYDGKLDPVIPEYFPDYLESIYPLVTGEYKTEPPVKTIIEVFPTHDAFSVRTTGSPWIGTVGACTGRVIALDAPRKGENTQGTFNWSQVLRHEFTHTVTLAATDNRIPHWMTEGLAVMEEHAPLQWAWVPMMYDAVSKHQLFDLDRLTWAFVRPRRPIDRQLGYAESFWICTYLDKTYGHDAILKMLAQFKAGADQEDVFPKILGKSQDQIFAEFSKWADQQIAGWGYDEQTSAKYEQLRARGDELVQGRQYDQAVEVWEQIAQLRPMDELPHRRLAGLYLRLNNAPKAIEQLQALHRVDIKDDAYPKRIARLYRDQDDLADAEHFALRAIYIDPYDIDAHELMQQLCEKAGDQAGANREQRVIPMLTQWQQQMEKSMAVQ